MNPVRSVLSELCGMPGIGRERVLSKVLKVYEVSNIARGGTAILTGTIRNRVKVGGSRASI